MFNHRHEMLYRSWVLSSFILCFGPLAQSITVDVNSNWMPLRWLRNWLYFYLFFWYWFSIFFLFCYIQIAALLPLAIGMCSGDGCTIAFLRAGFPMVTAAYHACVHVQCKGGLEPPLASMQTIWETVKKRCHLITESDGTRTFMAALPGMIF